MSPPLSVGAQNPTLTKGNEFRLNTAIKSFVPLSCDRNCFNIFLLNIWVQFMFRRTHGETWACGWQKPGLYFGLGLHSHVLNTSWANCWTVNAHITSFSTIKKKSSMGLKHETEKSIFILRLLPNFNGHLKQPYRVHTKVPNPELLIRCLFCKKLSHVQKIKYLHAKWRS